jgi:2-polyprenyl-3-methyl-5-hydroxy-6-metoxy-1,4-benzoquinol methylase
MSSAPASQPSPQLFFQTVNSYQNTQVLKTAIELDVFTIIGEGAATPAAIAAKAKASERGIRILCDALTILGFFTKKGSEYALTQDSSIFLSKKSPAYLGGSIGFLLHEPHVRRYDDLTNIVRKGGATGNDSAVDPEHPMWMEFARAMAPLMHMPAQAIAEVIGAKNGEPIKVLDIAAGHGVFGITIAQQNQKASIVAVDWANVLEVAKDNAKKAGVNVRYGTVAGSAFDVDFGKDFDVVLITNFLHHFDVTTCEKFLKKVYAALKPGGKAVTLEFVPNADRVTPPAAAMFSLMMLGSTPAGDAYTFEELESMCKTAGFKDNKLVAMPGSPESLVISVK